MKFNKLTIVASAAALSLGVAAIRLSLGLHVAALRLSRTDARSIRRGLVGGRSGRGVLRHGGHLDWQDLNQNQLKAQLRAPAENKVTSGRSGGGPLVIVVGDDAEDAGTPTTVAVRGHDRRAGRVRRRATRAAEPHRAGRRLGNERGRGARQRGGRGL